MSIETIIIDRSGKETSRNTVQVGDTFKRVRLRNPDPTSPIPAKGTPMRVIGPNTIETAGNLSLVFSGPQVNQFQIGPPTKRGDITVFHYNPTSK